MHAILAARSNFSIGESILTVERLVDAAAEVGATAVALTDTMSVTALIDFTNRCGKKGIKPIIGCRLRLVDDPTWRKPKGVKQKAPQEYFLTYYVLSEKGMLALFKLLTLANSDTHFYSNAKLGFDDLYAALATLTSDDVAIASSDVYSVFHHAQALDILQKIKSALGASNVFLTLSPVNTPLFDTLNQKAIEAAMVLSLPTLVTRPLYYGKDEADAAEVMGAITSNTPLSSLWNKSPAFRDLEPMTLPALVTQCKGAIERLSARRPMFASEAFKEGLKNTDRLVEMVKYKWTKAPVSLPIMAPDEFGAVVAECKKGWALRFSDQVFGHKPDATELATIYKERLKYELSVLKALKFSGYFLLVSDVVSFAKSNGILVGPGRGCFIPSSGVIMADGSRKMIETVRVGDKVIAHDGSIRTVIDTLTYGCDEEILELEFENGVVIRCTKDHEFFTRNRGWIQAQHLTDNDDFDPVAPPEPATLQTSDRSPAGNFA